MVRLDVNNYFHESVRKDTNDLVSRCAWVEEMEEMSYNPVLLFKPQGREQSESMNDLPRMSLY